MSLSPVSSAAAGLDPFPERPRGQPELGPELRGRARLRGATGVAPSGPVTWRGPDLLSFAGLAATVEDARAAALVRANGPRDPVVFDALRSRLEKARARLPPAYRAAVADPLLRELDRLGPRGFARILAEDPEREGAARLLLDVAQAVLQHGERFEPRATDALQEVVGDLYDGFLSAESRRGVRPPDRGVAAPLVRWGSADAGPYTWPADATGTVGVKAGIVSLPMANARAGILAWPALAHETAGHDILGADDGLRDELAGVVRERLLAARMPRAVADYWASRIDETASDVLGVLNMGPAAAVGLIGYFRGVDAAWGGTPTLRNVGPAEDPHPADIARAYLAAETVRLLSFDGAAPWADRLVAEADRDLGHIRLGGVAVSAEVAKRSAAVVAQAIAQTRVRALDGRALQEIQDWRNADEVIVAELRTELQDRAGPTATAGARTHAGPYAQGAYAAHAVAAGVYEAVGGTESPEEAMSGMMAMLDEMHDRNPEWTPPLRLPPAPSGARVA